MQYAPKNAPYEYSTIPKNKYNPTGRTMIGLVMSTPHTPQTILFPGRYNYHLKWTKLSFPTGHDNFIIPRHHLKILSETFIDETDIMGAFYTRQQFRNCIKRSFIAPKIECKNCKWASEGRYDIWYCLGINGLSLHDPIIDITRKNNFHNASEKCKQKTKKDANRIIETLSSEGQHVL